MNRTPPLERVLEVLKQLDEFSTNDMIELLPEIFNDECLPFLKDLLSDGYGDLDSGVISGLVKLKYDLPYVAACIGDLDLVKWCHTKDIGSTDDVFEGAAVYGKTEIMDWCMTLENFKIDKVKATNLAYILKKVDGDKTSICWLRKLWK